MFLSSFVFCFCHVLKLRSFNSQLYSALSVVTNTGIFLPGLKLCRELRDLSKYYWYPKTKLWVIMHF